MNESPSQPPLSQRDIEGSANQPPQNNYPAGGQQQNGYAQVPQQLPPQMNNGYPPVAPQSYSQQPGSQPLPYYMQQAPETTRGTQPKKIPKGRLPLVILGAVIVLAVVIGGATFFIMASSKKTADKSAEPTDSKPADPTEKPKQTTAIDTIAYLRNYFKGSGSAKTSLTTPVKTGNRAFYTVITDPKLVETTSISDTMPFEQVAENMVSLKRALDFYGYRETVINENQDNVNFLADYTREDVQCQIYAEKPADHNSPHYLEVKCLDTTQYDALAKEQEPFYRAYTEAAALGTPLILLGKAQINNSASAGYRLAEIQTGTLVENRFAEAGPIVKYYSGTDGIWRYFTNKTEVLPCATYYKSPSLTAAYLNMPCLNSKKQQVIVTLKRNNG